MSKRLSPIHKSRVKAMLRKGESFTGFIAPSNVNQFHINDGWHIGMSVTFTTIEDMETTIRDFAYYNCNSELGQHVRFWMFQ